MSTIGKIDSVWRYPVKSMRGEPLEQAFVGFAGVYGDRIYSFISSAAQKGFPYMTAREDAQMLLYRPRFRDASCAAAPINLAEAQKLAPGVTPLYAVPSELAVDVQTPSGEVLAVDDPAMVEMLKKAMGKDVEITLRFSERALTDCRPVSLISLQTARALSDEAGVPVDPRRFRANIYVDWDAPDGFAEDGLVGQTVRIGPEVRLSILERDPRCKMITLDPDTGESEPKILRAVAQAHDAKAGVFAAVLVEGTIRPGDDIELLD